MHFFWYFYRRVKAWTEAHFLYEARYKKMHSILK